MKTILSSDQISGKVLDHLGLVAATIDKIGLLEKIDRRLPLSKAHGAKTTIGQRVSAMIMNGLGFIDDRLYMFPEFLRNKPVDRLFGKGLSADDFNDDALGRALDKIYEYGITKLFSELAFEIGIEQKLLGNSAHIDTTSLLVYGDGYNSEGSPPSGVQPRHGFSKDHRPDLKQMVLNLATTGSAAFPIWMEPQSGNASDKKVLYDAAKRMKDFCMKLKDAPSFLFVADSAMYDACVKEAGELLWLSRVPASHQAAKDLLRLPDDKLCFVDLPNGYRMCVVETKYSGVHQRWAIVSSEHAYKREIITLEKRIEAEHAAAKNSIWHTSNQFYKCEQDAENAALKLSKKLKYHTLSTKIIAVFKHARSGRPRKGEDKVVASYRIEGELKRDESKIGPARLEKGRFILATNQLDRTQLSDKEILPEYKAQSGTESGFKFIKDDAFEVASIFLKKPQRIAALMMIMTLCLMVYNFAQHKLRSSLQQAKDTVPNPLNKATDNPTMKRVYRLFHGVQVITISLENSMQELVINLNAVTKKIVQYFGLMAMNIYGLVPI